MIRLRLLPIALAAAMVVAACGGAAQEVETADSAAPAPAADVEQSEAAPAPVQEAVEATPASELFGTFETIGNGQIDLGSLEGQDVVLWFWAPW